MRYFRERGWTRIAVITSTDGTGQDVEKQLDGILALPENKSVSFVIREHFNPTDISVSAQMQRIRSSNAQALLTWSTGTPFGTLMHGAHDAGIELAGRRFERQHDVHAGDAVQVVPAAGAVLSRRARLLARARTRRRPRRAARATSPRSKSAGMKPDIAPEPHLGSRTSS